MIGTLVAAALWALAASLLLSLALGLIVAGAIALTRPTAATRGALWSVALAAAGFAPVAIVVVMLVRGATSGETVMTPSAPTGPHWVRPAAPHRAAIPATAGAAAPARGTGLRIPGPPEIAPLVGGSIVAVWALGALIGLAGLGRSLARVRGLKGRSSPLEGPLATELPWLTTTAGREIYLRLSYETETPIAVGFRRPVILLPTEMATADGLASIEPLIMHEYAHLTRYDDWSNLAQRATERVFWFNPLIWILGRRIALEREVAADEAVVARTRDAKRYASTLWRMAQEMRMPEHVVVAPGAMLTRKQISVRIERLLDEHPVGRRHVGATAFAIAVVAATGVAGLAASAPPIVLVPVPAIAEPADVPSPAANVPPRTLRLIVKRPAPAPHIVAPPEPAPRLVAIARPHVMVSIDEKMIAEKAMKAIDARKIALDAKMIALQATTAAVTGDMLRNCVGCDFSHRDLRGADLSNLSLMGTDFESADLRGANLSNSKLQGLSFQRADLRNANLHGAKLTGVDFDDAVLDGADLSDATLTGVDLRHASLHGANTAGIRLFGSALP